MPFPTSIATDKLARLIGTANTPALIDVRTDEDFAADPRLIPGAARRNHHETADWGKDFAGRVGASLLGALAVHRLSGPQHLATPAPSREAYPSKV